MGRNVKCPKCSIYFDRDVVPYVHEKNRYWHKECYDKTIQSVTQEELDLRELEGYILKLLKLDYMNARVKKQIKTMMETYNFTYTGILKSLMYFYEVKDNNVEKANGGIGIVPYVYEEAKQYFLTIYMAQKQNENKSVSAYVQPGRIIIIKPPQKERKYKIINFDDIEKEIMDGE